MENEAELSKYEQQRLEHIRRNQEFMASLGISASKQATETPRQTGKKRRREPVLVPESLRRKSSRTRNIEPACTRPVELREP